MVGEESCFWQCQGRARFPMLGLLSTMRGRQERERRLENDRIEGSSQGPPQGGDRFGSVFRIRLTSLNPTMRIGQQVGEGGSSDEKRGVC